MRPVLNAIIIAAGYYLGAKLGFAFTLAPVPVSILWPPNSILLAGLLLTARREWPLVFTAVLGAHLAVQFQSGVPVGMVLCWFVSNCTEALIGAGLLTRFARRPLAFDTFRGSALFLMCAGLVAPFLSSFVDAAFVALNGWGNADYWTVWQTRFYSNVVASITLVPFILTSVRTFRAILNVSIQTALEASLGLTLLVMVCWLAFHSGPGATPAILYAPLPLLMAAAVRFGPWGASVSMLTCTLIAISGAGRGLGPFVTSSPAENAFSIQLFIIIAWVPVMSLAAVLRERAHANAKARSSEEQLAIAIETAQLGRWEWDIANRRLTWSDITRRMYEVPEDVPIGPETFNALVHPDDRPLIEAAGADAAAGRDIDVEFRVRFQDGRVKWIHSKGRTLCNRAGHPTRVVGVKVDITERKAAEMRIHEQQQDLARSSRTAVAGELSIALAHELNQPLAAILANAGAARRYLLTDPPDLRELGDIVEAIAHDNRRAANVITRFGTLLRRDPLRWTEIDMNELAATVIALARTDILSRGISVTKRFGRGLPPVLGDAVQLKQVLSNLVVNACEAMEATTGPRRLVVTTELHGGDQVRVCVADTGPGITKERFEDIFEPFVSSKPQRIGFGLAISRSIVTSHNGQIAVENQPEGGAVFSFSLPLALEGFEAEFARLSGMSDRAGVGVRPN